VGFGSPQVWRESAQRTTARPQAIHAHQTPRSFSQNLLYPRRNRVYYIEFVERNEGVPQRRFQEVVRMSNERWAANHPGEELVMIIGRTWRLGPKPTYMVVWKIKDFTTFETWNAEFRKQEILDDHDEFNAVGTIVDAGVYEDLGDEVL
jgi:hypothetical protein